MRSAQASRAVRVIQEWLDATGPDGRQHTQTELARLIGERLGRPFHQTSISYIARGQQSPRAEVVGAFKAVLGIEPEWWIPDARESSESVDGTGPRKTESGEHCAVAVDVPSTGTDRS